MAHLKEFGDSSLPFVKYIFKMPTEQEMVIAAKNEAIGLLIALERRRRLKNLHVATDFLLNGVEVEFAEDFDETIKRVNDASSAAGATETRKTLQLYNSEDEWLKSNTLAEMFERNSDIKYKEERQILSGKQGSVSWTKTNENRFESHYAQTDEDEYDSLIREAYRYYNTADSDSEDE